jgi:hypothetical protein
VEVKQTPIYWIDAGVPITAANGLYGFNLVPKFWSWLHGQMEAGTIQMPKLAFLEITDGNDELARWCKTRKNVGHFCVRPNPQVQSRYAEVAEYVRSKYKIHQVSEFLKGADGWIIAHALHTRGYVVTSENTKHNRSKIKIPTVAKALSVAWKTTTDMCSELGATFS